MNILKNKIALYVAWGILILDIAFLTIAGFTQEEISGVLAATVGIVGAVSGLVILIIKLVERIKNKETA